MGKPMLVIDLDGTLLTKYKRIKKHDLLALQKFVNNGGIPVIATGRSIVSAEKFVAQIEEFTQTKIRYVICFNGAYIFDRVNNVVSSTLIPDEIAKEIFDFAKENKMRLWFYTEAATDKKGVLAKELRFRVVAKFLKNLKLFKFHRGDDLSSFKINLFASKRETVRRAFEYLQNKYGQQLNVCFTSPWMLELNFFDVNKGSAVLKVAKAMNINKVDIYAIGDSNNDLPAFKVAGKSFAVKPKSNLVSDSATVVLPRKRAVAEAIEKHILPTIIVSKIRMLAVDLDGTLLENESKLIATRTIAAVEKVVNEHRIMFSLATGRSIDDCLIVLSYLKLDPSVRQFIIALNGAAVFDVQNKKFLFVKCISNKNANKIFEKIIIENNTEKYGRVGAIVYNNSSEIRNAGDLSNADLSNAVPFYGTNHDLIADCLGASSKNFTKNSWAPKKPIEIQNLENVPNVCKFVIYCEDTSKRDLFFKELQNLELDIELATTSSKNIEVTALNVSKGDAISFLTIHLGITCDQVMPIGDEGNDISMLKLSKNSVTLASSRNEVKSAASHIIAEPASLVVCEAINRLILK